jgi:hypothetical protein
VLVHVGDDVRESLLAEMDPDEIVAAVEDLDIDDLADLVEDLPDTVIDEVLKSMDRENRERLEQVLSYDGGHRRPPDESRRGDGARRHQRSTWCCATCACAANCPTTPTTCSW